MKIRVLSWWLWISTKALNTRTFMHLYYFYQTVMKVSGPVHEQNRITGWQFSFHWIRLALYYGIKTLEFVNMTLYISIKSLSFRFQRWFCIRRSRVFHLWSFLNSKVLFVWMIIVKRIISIKSERQLRKLNEIEFRAHSIDEARTKTRKFWRFGKNCSLCVAKRVSQRYILR